MTAGCDSLGGERWKRNCGATHSTARFKWLLVRVSWALRSRQGLAQLLLLPLPIRQHRRVVLITAALLGGEELFAQQLGEREGRGEEIVKVL